jgi:predicted GIY-YIG superfamily endonuclease
MDQHYYVYILKCADGSYYVGHTEDMDARLVAHQQKLIPCYTSTRLPIELLFVEECGSRDAAFRAERMIKGWSRAKKEILIHKGWDAMSGICKTLRLEKNKDAPSTPPSIRLKAHSAVAQDERGEEFSSSVN